MSLCVSLAMMKANWVHWDEGTPCFFVSGTGLVLDVLGLHPDNVSIGEAPLQAEQGVPFDRVLAWVAGLRLEGC